MLLQSSPGCPRLGMMQWRLESLNGDIWLFWGLLLGLQASGLTHPAELGTSQGATERLPGSHTLPLVLPAQPAGDQPGLSGQGEHNAESQGLLTIIEAFFLLAENAFLS